MSFLLRAAKAGDLPAIHRLATSLSAHGFLTLPTTQGELRVLLERSEGSFAGREAADEGIYLFVLEEEGAHKVIGTSQIVARHGTPKSPHLYFQVDTAKRTLKFCAETTGRTELGGLIVDPRWHGHPEKFGKRLSWARLWYIRQHPERFRPELLAEFLPPLTQEGKSLFWEALGRKLTGLDYPEADQRARQNKGFVLQTFPQQEIPLKNFPLEVQELIGVPGTGAAGAVRILEEVGFRHLNQVDPFDGGPHYGARQGDIRYDVVEEFLLNKTEVTLCHEPF